MAGEGDTLGSPCECPHTGCHPGLLFRGGGSVHLGCRDPGGRAELHDDRDLRGAVCHGGEGRGCWSSPPRGAAGREGNHGWALGGGSYGQALLPQGYLAELIAPQCPQGAGHGALPTRCVAPLLAPGSPGGGMGTVPTHCRCTATSTHCDTSSQRHPMDAPHSVSLMSSFA